MATPFDVLLTGDVIGAAIQVYTDVLGDWFYVICLFALLTMLYFKSKNVGIISIVGIMVSTAMVQYNLLPGEAIQPIYIIFALSIAGVLYATFGSRSD